MNIAQALQHYRFHSRTGCVEELLNAVGLDRTPLSVERLAPLDQFHSGGLAATIELASELKLLADDRVLDIGSGLGGPSHYVAATYGCSVDGVDLSPSLVEAANLLAEKTLLSPRVRYTRADALSLPFESNAFDVV
ncbi:methyltransferase domain-containing protein [Paraburkholderia sp. SIMBA_053]|uniref:methyltransferase domain-containing protein n=1 Tax=Paraburkholderia sp. SIMBA_053 TaxID=3085794 RepID=UPI00397A02B4